MGTFHPAALLRNPLNKPDALSDFQKLRDKINELNIEI
jgi:DNA polymerase